jgi:tetratricopeptide (TPR) repeat protein
MKTRIINFLRFLRKFHFSSLNGKFLFPALLMIAAATGYGQDKMELFKKHFEWGEYDSLLAKAPGLIAGDSSLSEAQKAELHKYLGVVHFQKGDTSSAVLSYQEALTLAPETDLDLFFVDSLTHIHFNKVKQSFLLEIKELQSRVDSTMVKDTAAAADSITAESVALADSALPYSDSAVSTADMQMPDLEPEPVQPVYSKTDFRLSTLSFAGAGLFAFLAYTKYIQAEQHYRDYKSAAEWGREDPFLREKEEVQKYDLWTVIYGSLAVMSAATGTYFTLWHRVKSPQAKKTKTVINKVEVSITPSDILTLNLKYRF